MTKTSKILKKPATHKAAGKVASKPIGRPTLYRVEFCEKIVTLMRDGLSMEGVASDFGVTKETLYDWMRTYPDFSDAHKIGKAACAAWWEGKLRASDSPSSIIFALRNLAPETWKDKSEVELSGNADKPIYVMMTAVDGKL